jgi:tripartite-type tricarboxylate transporter receptor subunit TctC
MKRLICVIAVTVLLGAASAANGQDNFFAGKKLMITIASSSGGGQDAYGRLIARHIGQYIPGSPTVIPVNMPGAAGRTAVRSLDIGTKDGTNIVAFSAQLVITNIIEHDTTTGKFSRFGWVGSVGREPRICFTNASTGIKTWDDLLKRKGVVFGNVGTDAIVTYIKGSLNADIRLVLGYPGLAEKRLAVERGELDGDCGTISSIPPEWLSEHRINAVLKLQDMPMKGVSDDVPYIGTLVKSDPPKRQLLNFISTSTDLGRPFITSAGVPRERLAVLQKAFEQMVADPQFRADADRQKLDVTPISGEELQRMIDEVENTPEAVVDAARAQMAN